MAATITFSDNDIQPGSDSPPAITTGPSTITFSDSDIQQAPQPAPRKITFSDSDIQDAPRPAPAELQTGGLNLPSNMSIRASQPSVWQRIKNVFTEGIPQFSSRTVYNPKFGQQQFLSPEEAMTPAEQARHPVLTATGEIAGGFTSPESIAIIGATGGLGEIGGAAGKILPRLVSAGFSLQQLYGAAKESPELWKAIKEGDYNRAEYLATRMGLQTGMAVLGARHAIKGKAAVTGKTSAPEAPAAVETHPIPADEPAAKILQEPAPGVRVTESTAAKQHIIAQETVAEPKTPLRVFHGTTARVEDISQLDPNLSRDGAAGRGIYLTDVPQQASAYAGPAEMGTSGRVLAGLLSEKANLLNGDKPLPEPVRAVLQNEFPDLDTSKSYVQVLNDARAGNAGIEVTPDAVQSVVENAGDYDGVRYEHEYAEGPRRAIMLFRNSAELLKPTVPTARIVSEDHLPVVSRGEILTEAVQRMVDNSRELQKIGLDPEKIRSREDVPAMLESVAGHIKANLDPRVGATIGFEAQKALASDLGMDVEDLLARKSGQAYSAEQAIAARALLRDSATRVMNLARIAAMGDTDYQAKFAESMAQHQAVIETVKGAAAEAGRALGSFRIKGSELPALKISDAFAKLSPDALQKAAELLSKVDPNDTRQVNDFIEKIKPASTADKVFEYYRNALLSSPKTVTVKTASEVAMIGLEAMKKFVASGLSQDRFAAESWSYARGALQALQHAPDILAGRFELEDAPGFEGGGKQALKGTLGQIVRFPGTVLERGANLMYSLNYFGELRAQATRAALKEGLSGQELYARTEYLAANPTEKMTDAAHQTALHGTFQNELGKFGKSVQRAIQTDPTGVSRYLFPFFRTPINLVKASGEFSPYGLLKGLAKGDADATSRGLVGSSIAAGIAVLALEGQITGGGPVDYKKKQTLEATGWQPYSVKIGNRYIAYHRFEPLGLVMGLVSDVIHGMKTGDSEQVTSSKADTAVAHIQRNLSDLPFMYGLSSIVDALKDTSGKRVDNFVARQVASFVPAGVANIAEGMDRTVRHPTGVAETLQSRIPGLTGNVPPSLDVTGQPIQRPASQLGGANPFPVTSAKNDAVLSELARLGVATAQPPKSVKLGRQTVELSESERGQLAQWEGEQLYKRLASVVPTDFWKRLPDERKLQAIKTWRAAIDRSRPYRLAQIRRGGQAFAAANAE